MLEYVVGILVRDDSQQFVGRETLEQRSADQDNAIRSRLGERIVVHIDATRAFGSGAEAFQPGGDVLIVGIERRQIIVEERGGVGSQSEVFAVIARPGSVLIVVVGDIIRRRRLDYGPKSFIVVRGHFAQVGHHRGVL